MRTILLLIFLTSGAFCGEDESELIFIYNAKSGLVNEFLDFACLLYTSPSPRDVEESRMPSSA